jgi:cellulose synthase/poly-beta-1,6-N-acetylglucosamine synthase-like glycosyltransferase
MGAMDTTEHENQSEQLPVVTVIVPVLDGLDLLVRCVRALLDQDYPAELLEIVVADNGSAVDPAPHLPRDPRLTVVHEPTPGSYAARNAALLVAKGEVLAFTDADCLPDRSWVREAVAALRAEPRAAAGPPTAPSGTSGCTASSRRATSPTRASPSPRTWSPGAT